MCDPWLEIKLTTITSSVRKDMSHARTVSLTSVVIESLARVWISDSVIVAGHSHFRLVLRRKGHDGRRLVHLEILFQEESPS